MTSNTYKVILQWHGWPWHGRLLAGFASHGHARSRPQKDLEKIKAIQMKLVNSFATKAIAVKIVTSNKGKNTPALNKCKGASTRTEYEVWLRHPGVDNVLWNSPELKCKGILELDTLNFWRGQLFFHSFHGVEEGVEGAGHVSHSGEASVAGGLASGYATATTAALWAGLDMACFWLASPATAMPEAGQAQKPQQASPAEPEKEISQNKNERA
jgi:hypothetical protein